MTTNQSRVPEPGSGYIGEGVVFKGSISAPGTIGVDGIVEGDVTARSIRVGVAGSIRGSVACSEADVHGKLCDKVDVKDFLLVRSTGRIEGNVTCGEMQIDKGAVLAASVTSVIPSVEEKQSEPEISPPARITLQAAE